jgi:hypothetical protein
MASLHRKVCNNQRSATAVLIVLGGSVAANGAGAIWIGTSICAPTRLHFIPYAACRPKMSAALAA